MIPVVMLCGGLGTRIAPHFPHLPKAMIPIDDTPFLQILVQKWVDDGYDDFIFAVGEKQEVIRNHPWHRLFPSMKFRYVETANGTGPAVLTAFLQHKLERAWVVNGDTYQDFVLPPIDYAHVNVYATCDNMQHDAGAIYATKTGVGIHEIPYSIHDLMGSYTRSMKFEGKAYDIGTIEGLDEFRQWYERSKVATQG